MVKKTVYIGIEGRLKKINFQSDVSSGESDVDSLCRAVHVAAEKDLVLQKQLAGCDLVFQTKITVDGEEVWLDIEGDEEIEADKKYNLHLVRTADANITSQTLEVLQVSSLPSHALSNEGGLLGNIEIVDEELQPVKVAETCDSGFSTSECASNVVKPTVLEEPEVNLSASLVEVPESRSYQPVNVQAFRKLKLPEFTKSSALANVVQFYCIWVEDKYGKTDISPVYRPLAEKICDKFPHLLYPENPNPYGVVQTSISAYFRNKRCREKKRAIGSLQTSSVPSAALSTSQGQVSKRKHLAVFEGSSEPDPKRKESEKFLETLKSLKHVGATAHVTKLFRESFQARREWINQVPDGTSISCIVKEHPHLANPDLLLLEYSLILGQDVPAMEKKLEKLWGRLALFLGKKVNFDNAREVCLFLIGVNEKYKPKNKKKTDPYCITVEEVLADPSDAMMSQGSEGGRLIIFFQNDIISLAFIIADQKIKIKFMNSPKLSMLVLCLLATYSAWDQFFPAVSKCFLRIQEETGLGRPCPQTSKSKKCSHSCLTYDKFVKEFKDWQMKNDES